MEVDVQYERMKVVTVKRLATNLYDKNKFVIHLGNLQQVLNHGLFLRKVYKVITFN